MSALSAPVDCNSVVLRPANQANNQARARLARARQALSLLKVMFLRQVFRILPQFVITALNLTDLADTVVKTRPVPAQKRAQQLRPDAGAFAVLTTFPDIQVGETIAGKYQISSRLGHGGFGEVFMAKDLTDRSDVVLKRSFPGEGPQRGFEAEYEAMQVLAGGPNLVRFRDLVEERGEQFLVTDYAPGQNLAYHIFYCSVYFADRTSKVYTDYVISAFKIIAGVCNALDYIHGKGRLHLDLGDNIVVGDNDEATVLDLGLDKLFEEERLNGRAMGKDIFNAPEQARAEACDGRADLYTLGIIARLMFEGSVEPLAGERDMIAFKRSRGRAFDWPLQTLDLFPSFHGGLAASIEKFITTLYAASPDQRYQSASDARVAALQIIDQIEQERGLRVSPFVATAS